MAQVVIPCPRCHAKLRLHDRRLLGRRGKCPHCEHQFVLGQPDEVELELANAPVQEQTPVGTSPRWMADAAPESPAFQAPTGSPCVPDGTDGQSPDFGQVPRTGPASGGINRLRQIRHRDARRRKKTLVALGVLSVVVVAGFLVIKDRLPDGNPPAPAPRQVDSNREQDNRERQTEADIARQHSPTSGEPIELKYVPTGTSIVVHLRASELWHEQGPTEVIACLGTPINRLLDRQFKELCRFTPAEIDEVTFCLTLGARGTRPELAAIIRLQEQPRRSELLRRFDGQRNDQYGHPVYVSGEWAYMIADERTFSVGPLIRAEEMVSALEYPQPTSGGIEMLLKHTDRDRHVTVVFQPRDLRVHQDTLVADDLVDGLNVFVDWFEKDVEAVAWSLHSGSEFFSETILRNRLETSPAQLQRELTRRLNELPYDVLALVELMDPKSSGHRRIIGRFPAMTKALTMGTNTGIGERFVRLTTVLPERAGPNLALATVLTWDESRSTDLGAAPAVAGALPETMAGRLQMTIDVDFRRTPLYEAFEIIADEIKLRIVIDGDALKLAGFTQNMEQNIQLGEVPAIDGIRAILKQYAEERDPLAVVVDQTGMKLTVLTNSAARKRGLETVALE